MADNISTITGGALDGQRLRVLISTDIGGSDPDDFQSLVHYLMYADRFDTEGLVSSPPGAGRKEHILETLERYEADFPKLKARSPRFPTPRELRAVTKQGTIDSAPAPGFSAPSEGSEWIVERAMQDDPRPLYILVWGSLTDVAQALHDEPRIKKNVRVYAIGSWNTKMDPHAREYVYRQHRDLWWIEADTTFRGMYIGGDQSGDLSNREFPRRYLAGHGALGDFFTGKLPAIKMGDTPSVLYLLRGNPEDPAGPHWGGAFARNPYGPTYWTDDRDESVKEGEYTGAKTVSRWRADYLRDWQRRMEWLK